VTIDPEADRFEKANTESPEWDRAILFAKLLDMAGAIHIPGCDEGSHDWTSEYIGDPPGAEPRILRWSNVRVECRECGQTANLVFDPPTAEPRKPENPRVMAITGEDIRKALKAGRDGSKDLVSIQEIPASSLYTAVRLAWKYLDGTWKPLGEAGDDD
jgi:hypothetical protein